MSLKTKLNRTVLSIDPASGSTSEPGYALFVEGKLVQSGTIKSPRGRQINQRLQVIADTLREQFPIPDVLIIEHIPPSFGPAATVAVAALHKSIGAILASVRCKDYIEVAPASWHAVANRLDFKYEKSDEKDAIIIGWTVLKLAGLTIDEEEIVERLRGN